MVQKAQVYGKDPEMERVIQELLYIRMAVAKYHDEDDSWLQGLNATRQCATRRRQPSWPLAEWF